MVERWPRLSQTLRGPRDLQHCQACGTRGQLPGAEPPALLAVELQVWREHDDQDKPEPLFLVLCGDCAGRRIEKHPRLYAEVDFRSPEPGVMPVCVLCRHREGFRCANPIAKANGGPGLRLDFPTPLEGFIDYSTGPKGGRRAGHRFVSYRGPVTCAGRELVREGAPDAIS